MADNVLVVDDEPEVVELLCAIVRQAGFVPVPAHDNPSALAAFEREQPILVLLDIVLGRWNGLDLLLEIRQRSDVPIILLTGRMTEADVVRGLELGADDYVTKPFRFRELIARVRAHARRRGVVARVPRSGDSWLEVGRLKLNLAEHAAMKDQRPLSLTLTEFALLEHLMANAGMVVRTDTLLREVWGYTHPDGAEVLRVALHRLRRKVEDDASQPRLLHTVPGVGVILKPEAS
jgi:DNA-binding response OmpR family regulator